EGSRFFGEEGKVVYQFEDVAATPEPAGVLLALSGIGGLLARRCRMSANAARNEDSSSSLLA
ncbi:MAG TPA: hypothetical protein VFV33_18465, partial [Gemmatimonadaceae bacterium]|nr:hypothetical protein [Gemmatimonadaceae bacterium]